MLRSRKRKKTQLCTRCWGAKALAMRLRAARTVCKRGHQLPAAGGGECRECVNIRARESRQRVKERKKARVEFARLIVKKLPQALLVAESVL